MPAFENAEVFGEYSDGAAAIYQVQFSVGLHIVAMIPTMILGVIGAILGTIFTILNLKVSRLRAKYIALHRWRRITETCIIMFIMATLAVFLPASFPCATVNNCRPWLQKGETLVEHEEFVYECGVDGPPPTSGYYPHVLSNVEHYTCSEWERGRSANASCGYEAAGTVNIHYSPMATLMYMPGEDVIKHLFSRGTQQQLGYGPLFTFLIVYFFGIVPLGADRPGSVRLQWKMTEKWKREREKGKEMERKGLQKRREDQR